MRDATRRKPELAGPAAHATWIVLLGLTLMTLASAVGARTVLYGDSTTQIDRALEDPEDLWISPADLTRTSGFVVKKEGACLEEICVPIDDELLQSRADEDWFNVAELARRLGQSYAADREAGVWSFDAVPATRRAFLDEGQAPDFALPDRNGAQVALSDFRGKKVLIITWASW